MTDNGEIMYALDIGTRSVTGLILKQRSGSYELIDVESREHKERSMMDGQIHNVAAVSDVIQETKAALEERHGPLHKVCAAAAGRSLKTQRASMELDISGQPCVFEGDIAPLELGAVQKAQHQLAFETERDSDKSLQYHCVGYSVVAYYIDGQEIGSLLDQSGEKASADVIATFLPKVVVESLISALQRADLELEALTLEPIAAINVLIPPSMRRLNVALVDIGAGTSDIAITDLGTVTAYGMVPVAGDEVTEALSDEFLLDFPDAERVKRNLAAGENVLVTDILGMETEYPPEDVISPIRPSIKQLAAEISSEILTLNTKPPKAVMLVGGGSMTPEISRHLSEALHLPENRVAPRDIEAIKNLSFEGIHPGPELVTPVGIAIAAKEHPVEYIPVYVNGRSIRLFDVKTLTIGDAVLASGLSIRTLYGKPGDAMVITLNERIVSIPGTRGEAPVIRKNGLPASIKDPIAPGDELVLEKGEDGQPASAAFRDIVDEAPEMKLVINDRKYSIPPLYVQNGRRVAPETTLNDRDDLVCRLPESIQEVWEIMKWTIPASVEHSVYYIDNKEVPPPQDLYPFHRNGHPAFLQEPVRTGDNIVTDQEPKTVTVRSLLEHQEVQTTAQQRVFFNGETVNMEKKIIEADINGEKAGLDDQVASGDHITTEKTMSSLDFIVQDVFSYVTVDLQYNAEKTWNLTKNRQPASFTEALHGGDHIELQLFDKSEKRSAE
ncbi:cell division protein FtsA [Salibacterium halotolerans]|uniref:Cell division protein FtsA n=1 Tax=Salibacterium halotolerans TaxID=1884432 RepID=A0A1I5VK22_9BACI|nr:cell division protein FtsA [Salibacterium halotolerans]SFQ07904.1 cell division protein FtsA [Salibacterium halotolerans]